MTLVSTTRGVSSVDKADYIKQGDDWVREEKPCAGFLPKYEFKKQQGFDVDKIKVPGRFYETISQLGMVKEETIQEMLNLYKKKTRI